MRLRFTAFESNALPCSKKYAQRFIFWSGQACGWSSASLFNVGWIAAGSAPTVMRRPTAPSTQTAFSSSTPSFAAAERNIPMFSISSVAGLSAWCGTTPGWMAFASAHSSVPSFRLSVHRSWPFAGLPVRATHTCAPGAGPSGRKTARWSSRPHDASPLDATDQGSSAPPISCRHASIHATHSSPSEPDRHAARAERDLDVLSLPAGPPKVLTASDRDKPSKWPRAGKCATPLRPSVVRPAPPPQLIHAPQPQTGYIIYAQEVRGAGPVSEGCAICS